MELILCSNCDQPLIEDIGDIEKCKHCKIMNTCPLHSSQCKNCRQDTNCKKSIKQGELCINCEKSIKDNIINFPDCKICFKKTECLLIELFCEDCLEIIHNNPAGLKKIIDSFDSSQKHKMNQKIKEILKNKNKPLFPPDINDLFTP